MEKNEQEESLIQKEQYKAKKKIIIIILTILGVALTIGAFVYIAIIVQEKYDNEEDKEKENITEKFEYGLTLEELENRTSPGHLGKLIYLKKDSKEYKGLEDGDKTALKYLTKAAVIMDEVFLRLDNVHNIPFKKFLESEINNSTNTTNTTRIKQANLTKILFDSFKGINGYDTLGEEVNLAKNITSTEVLGLYPEDLTEKKFHEILIQMLKENKTEEVRNITNQRTIVLWDKNKTYLTSIDYVEYFKDNFTEVADLFLNASKCSTNAKFNNFLELQAEALKKIDPNKDFEAEKIYAELQDTPLELTLMKEDYDIFTETALENEELKQLLDKNNIKTYSKDVLGLRVGIVNKEGEFEKMSKSLGNFLTVRDISEQYSLEVLRFFMLGAHYRNPINFSDDLMEAAKNGLERIKTCGMKLSEMIEKAQDKEVSGTGAELSEEAAKYTAAFEEAMDDDFNTADAVAAVFDYVKFINTNVTEENSSDVLRDLYDKLKSLTGVLGLELSSGGEELLDDEIEALIKERNDARAEKNFARADEIRDMLLEKGIVLEDKRDGVRWKRR